MKYILDHKNMDGTIIVGYNQRGFLTYFEMSAALEEKIIMFMHTHIDKYRRQEDLPGFCAKACLRWKEMEEDMSFEAFWNLYGHKRDKDRCRKIFERLDESTIPHIFKSTHAYRRYMLRNPWYHQMSGEKFLRDGYENDWNKL